MTKTLHPNAELIGRECYVLGRYGNTKTKVTKVSPTGRITVQMHGEAVAVFEPTDVPCHDGLVAHYEYCSRNSIYYRDNRRLTFDVAGVEAGEAALKRAKEAARALNVVARAAEDCARARHEWSAETMLDVLAKLEAEIEAAKAAIAAR